MDVKKIGVFGLGYVGLPLAIEFSKFYQTIGFDINQERVRNLIAGMDQTLEVEQETLLNAFQNSNFEVVGNSEKLRDCNVYIVTVPTPIDKNNQPDLGPLMYASKIIGGLLCPGDIVIYESTVYPGATENDCVPVLEEISGLKFNQDFFCGYSPERINPGDKIHTVTRIKKVTSGSNTEIADVVDALYQKIITAGTHKAPSIMIAEAAKVIENSQRDINIAFMNELALIFNKMNIDTTSVLEAAGTKWNFLDFRPGLVGGHCIGVDPYYLAYKAQEIGYHPEIILAGRRINDSMSLHIANQIVKLLIKNNTNVNTSKVLIMGITFKENCPDIRNSKVHGMIGELEDFGIDVHVSDPWANPDEVAQVFGKNLIPMPNQEELEYYDLVVFAVAHKEFMSINFPKVNKPLVYDVKGVMQEYDARL